MARHLNGELSDDQLLELCRQGDRSAFSDLWERHRRPGIAAARRIAPSLDPDDLVSSAYLKIYEMILADRGPRGAFRPYLYRVISTIAADTFRMQEYSSDDLDSVPEQLHEAGPWEDDAFDLNAAARAFEGLPERWQAVLWYTEVEGMPPREAAPLLGLSPNGVSALAARAREGLQSGWVEAHVDMQVAEERCRSTLERLQRYQRGKLTARASREVAAHLDECRSCAAAGAEFSMLNSNLALALASIVLGGGLAAATAELLGLSLPSGAAATAAAGTGAAGASGAGGASSGSSSASAAGGAATAATSSAGSLVLAVATPLVAIAVVGGGVLLNSVLGDDQAAVGAPIGSAQSSEASPARTTDSDDSAEREDRGRKDRAIRPTDPPVLPAGSLPVPPPPADGTNHETTAPPKTQDSEDDDKRDEKQDDRKKPDDKKDPEKKPDDKENPDEGEENPPPADDGDASILPAEGLTYFSGAGMTGYASEYGVIRLRAIPQGGAPVEILHPMYDPALEGSSGNLVENGAVTDLQGNSFGFGFYTGTDPGTGPNAWFAEDPAPYLLAHGLSIDSVSLEMRLVTPDGRYSRWTPLNLD